MRTFQRYIVSVLLVILAIFFIITNIFHEEISDPIEIIDRPKIIVHQEIHIETTSACGKYQIESQMEKENLIWQTFRMNMNVSMSLLAAYLDDRRGKKVVRVNSIGSHLNISNDIIYCQLWFDENSEPLVLRAVEYQYMWYANWWEEGSNRIKPEYLAPILIECPLDTPDVPKSVSLTANPCDVARNNLKIIDNKPEDGVRKKFGVCTKNIYFDHRKNTIKFIEWVKMLQILGASKIHLFNERLHPDFQTVVDKLESLGEIEVQRYMEPQGRTVFGYHTVQAYLIEMVLLNDCLYRNRKLYEFIAFVDPDEVIMPTKDEDKTWFDLMKNFEPIDRNSLNSITAVNLYFPPNNATPFDDIPKYHYMLQNNQRVANDTKTEKLYKSFIIPDNIFYVAQHLGMRCFGDVKGCLKLLMPKNISQLYHYRNSVDGSKTEKTKKDTTLEKYHKELVKAVNETLIAIDFIP